MTTQIFEKGDTVTWKNIYANMIATYGNGPFTVSQVIPVPRKERENTGHPQRLVIEKVVGETRLVWLPSKKEWGEPIANSEDTTEEPAEFSGVHFKQAA